MKSEFQFLNLLLKGLPRKSDFLCIYSINTIKKKPSNFKSLFEKLLRSGSMKSLG